MNVVSGPLYDNLTLTLCVISVIKRKLGGETLLEGKHQELADLSPVQQPELGKFIKTPPFTVSGNCPKGREQMEKYLFRKIY